MGGSWRAQSKQLEVRRTRLAAWSFIAKTVEAYVEASGEIVRWPLPVAPLTVALTYSSSGGMTSMAGSSGILDVPESLRQSTRSSKSHPPSGGLSGRK